VLVAARSRARGLCHALNAAREAEREERWRILAELFGAGGDAVWMQPPFYCAAFYAATHPADAQLAAARNPASPWRSAAMSGWRRRRYSSRRAHRLAGGHRRGQRRDARHSRKGFAAGNPCRVIRDITD
jgi:hypothetical protein